MYNPAAVAPAAPAPAPAAPGYGVQQPYAQQPYATQQPYAQQPYAGAVQPYGAPVQQYPAAQPYAQMQPQQYPSQPQTVVVAAVQPVTAVYVMDDDPTALYILAVISFFIPLIGLICMCVHNCGTNYPPRKKQAFNVMAAATLISLVLGSIIIAV